MLSEYINFTILFNKFLNDDEVMCILKHKNNIFSHYIDNDICKIRYTPLYNTYFEMLQNASTFTYIKNNEIIEHDELKINILSFNSTVEKFNISHIKIIQDKYDKEYEMICLIDDNTKKYIMIGLDEYHPFIYTNEFEYYQSDGSTNFDMEYLNDDCNISTLFTFMMKYLMSYTYVLYP